MKLITRQTMADETANQMLAQYPPGTPWPQHRAVAIKVQELGPHPDPFEVEAITGNNRCDPGFCDECRCHADILVVIGQEPDTESSTATICQPCLQKALDLAEAERALQAMRRANQSAYRR